MTEEHLWSDWMTKDKLLPREGDNTEFAKVFRVDQAPSDPFERIRQGAPSRKRIKVVCKRCNSGWMSLVEVAAKPHLTLLIKGEPALLTAEIRLILTEWIVMKVLTVEHNKHPGHPANPIFGQDARAAFMESRKIPSGFRIWIGFHNSPKWRTGFHRHATGLGWTKPAPAPVLPKELVKNVQSVTWGIGQLLIYLDAVVESETTFGINLDARGILTNLWPGGYKIAWPPDRIMSEREIDLAALALERMASSPAVHRQ